MTARGCLCLSALAGLLLVLPLRAQAPERYTLGLQLAALGGLPPAPPGPAFLQNFYPTCECAFEGGGVRFTARLVSRLGLDTELDFFSGGTGVGGLTELLAGPRLRLGSIRWLRVFGYLRPGWLSVADVPAASQGPFPYSTQSEFFVINPGLSVEFHAGRHFLGRLDFSDLRVTGTDCGACSFGVAGFEVAQNSIQLSLGVACQF